MGEETKTVAPQKYEDLIACQLTSWRSKLVERYFNYEESTRLRKKDPRKVIQTQQGKMPIQDIITVRWEALREASNTVDVLEEMYEKIKAGESVIADNARDWTENEPSFVDIT